jgi:hypothetical protein
VEHPVDGGVIDIRHWIDPTGHDPAQHLIFVGAILSVRDERDQGLDVHDTTPIIGAKP